ncbi:H-type small acid-soluble spore protein [Anaerosolibacter sp.]|uniref:H-type small acid-soluble spore protein n=1 Tax=Anaerosolibacter sp. TaxID=1872527 RepID=UPI0039EF4CBF
MILDRAQEILNSKETIPVSYKGTPIWIERINPKDQTALVTGETGQYTVNVTELIEQELYQ